MMFCCSSERIECNSHGDIVAICLGSVLRNFKFVHTLNRVVPQLVSLMSCDTYLYACQYLQAVGYVPCSERCSLRMHALLFSLH